MPGRKKKPFIDRKSSVSFHLVHRSQRDPLQADEDSSKFVLLQKQKAKEKEELEKQKSQEREFGVFYDDDYNYLQHLKDANPAVVWSEPTPSSTQQPQVPVNVQVPPQVSKLGLPSDVFPSETEEKVGLLNKAAPVYGPRLDLDPDLVAAMDEDFDFEDPDNELEDDFILIAQDETDHSKPSDGKGDGSESDDDEDYLTDELEDSDDEGNPNYDQKTYLSEETKTQFTNYSITSSVMRRNDGLTLLDDRFEKLYEQYDDMEIGALDHDDIDGHREVDAENDIMKQVMDEYIASQQKSSLADIRREGKLEDGKKQLGDYDEGVDDENDEEGDENEDRVKLTVTETKKDERWDCESILSTYSTLYNHPTTIKEPTKKKSGIRLSQKTGMPLDTLPSPGPTKKQQERELHDEFTLPTIAPTRPTDRKETPEEKKLRKQAVKEDRRYRRLEKKANKQAFKDEEKKQGLAMVHLKKNMQGIRIV
ncbi:protein LTV1 homolog [Asterias rubens]|uniref:protein LTV1 homolog n=1 Tax=Asterias rubens TaxID=7604 RepID=UPI001455515C|nr:protein LTV1 homolog [Asterias rubens]